jgi:hypothetical protein
VTRPSQHADVHRPRPREAPFYVIEPSEPVPRRLRLWFRLRRLGGFFAFLLLVFVTLGAVLGIAHLVPSEGSPEAVRTVASAFESRPATTTAPAAARPVDRVRPSGVPAVSATPGAARRTAVLSWGPAVDDTRVVRYYVWLDRLRATTVDGAARSTGLAFLDCRRHRVAIAAVDAAKNVGPVTTTVVRPRC